MEGISIWGSSTSVDAVDVAQIDSKVSKNGDEMRGNLQMNGNKIKGLPTNINQIEDSDAASYSVCNELLINGLLGRVSKDGDDITGDLFLKNGFDNVRMLGCNDLNNKTGFSLLLGTYQNQIHYERQDTVPQPIKVLSSNGTLFQLNGSDYLRIGSADDPRITAYKPIRLMMGDPIGDNDAATKRYVDNKIIANQSGLIPPLTGSTSNRSGHIVSVSSQYNSNYAGVYCFMPQAAVGEWATLATNTNFWIKIQCPQPILVSSMQIRGRVQSSSETLNNWRLEGSNDNTTWDTLFSSNQPIKNNVFQFVFNPNPTISYTFYRIFCVSASGTNPGLSYIQFF